MEIFGFIHFFQELGVCTWNLMNLDIRVNSKTLVYVYINTNIWSYYMIIIYLYLSVSTSAILGGEIWIPPLVAIYNLVGTYINWTVISWFIRYMRVGCDVFIYWKGRILKWSLFFGLVVWLYLPCSYLHWYLNKQVIKEWVKIEWYKM